MIFNSIYWLRVHDHQLSLLIASPWWRWVSSCWRRWISSWWVSLGRRWRWVCAWTSLLLWCKPIRLLLLLPWWWCPHLLNNWLHIWIVGWDNAWVHISLIQLHLVLSLHASTHSAPHDVCKEIYNPSNIIQHIITSNARCQPANASKILSCNHDSNNGIVALSVHKLHFILQHPTCGSYRLREAAGYLHA